MRDNRGFTLLEIILSVAIFSIGIMAAFGLAISDMNHTKENYNKVKATHLAREGIELIRNVRDSNWLKYQANFDCDDGTAGIQYCEYDEGLESDFFVIDYATTTPKSVCAGKPFDSCLDDTKAVGATDNICINSQECDLFTVDNYYVHDSTTTTLRTNVYRVMQIKKICLNSATDEEYLEGGADTCNGGDEKIGMEVTARVRWEAGSKIDYIDIVTYLYDWRY